MPIGKDTYMLTRTEERFDGSSNAVKAKILKQANEYCQKLGKVLQVVSHSQKDMVFFTSDATAEVQFMCLDANDPRLKSTALQRVDSYTKEDQAININKTEVEDKYTRLQKLEALRNSKTLTEEEFLAEKKKLLESN